MLRRNGYNVSLANDGLDALAIYAQRENEINLVLTDVMMPELDGTKLTRALKKMNAKSRSSPPPARPTTPATSELKQLGVKAILLKPYRTEKLLVALDQTIHG